MNLDDDVWTKVNIKFYSGTPETACFGCWNRRGRTALQHLILLTYNGAR